jgi:hypothetical protein
MKTSILRLTLLISLGVSCSAPGQANIVGYINRPIFPGDNLVANQLIATPNNSLNNILIGVADGATFTKWDATANVFLPLSTFSLSTHTWSINYTLNLGEGALIHSPSQSTNTFVGEVGPYLNEFGPPRQVGWNPGYADGLHLISNPIPFNDATFNEVVGRAPEPGEWVRILHEPSQTYFTTTFDGSVWDNGAPALRVAQAAWFNLGPVTVPEPSSLALVAAAGLIGWRFRKRRE